MNFTRREVFAAATTVGLSGSAGCLIADLSGGEPVSDIEVSNHAGSQRSGAFEVTHVESGEVEFSDSFTLADGQREAYGNVLTRGGEYEISIESGELAETYRWTERGEDRTPEDDGLLVQIQEDGFTFSPFE